MVKLKSHFSINLLINTLLIVTLLLSQVQLQSSPKYVFSNATKSHDKQPDITDTLRKNYAPFLANDVTTLELMGIFANSEAERVAIAKEYATRQRTALKGLILFENEVRAQLLALEDKVQ